MLKQGFCFKTELQYILQRYYVQNKNEVCRTLLKRLPLSIRPLLGNHWDVRATTMPPTTPQVPGYNGHSSSESGACAESLTRTVLDGNHIKVFCI